MAHVDAESLSDPERIYLARKLREAQAVEDLLTRDGVDYAVQVEPYARGFLFRSVKQGAMFYVAASRAAYSRERLAEAGYRQGVVEE